MKVSVRCISLVLISSLLITCSPGSLFVDHWNKKTDKLFERTESPYKDSPDAVVVFDLEHMLIDKGTWDLVRMRHVRIQIFNEEGKEYANVRIPFWHDETIADIKAQTILPDGSRINLKSSDVFEEGDKKGWRFKTFAVPGVTDNCIIEYQYLFRSDRLAVLDPKYFQGYLQTEYAQFSVVLPQGFSYSGSMRNPITSNTQPVLSEMVTPDGEFTSYYWEYANIPPLRDEPFMYNREDHLFTLHMQLVSYVDPYNNIKFIKSWDDLAKKVRESYKTYLNPSRKFKKLLADIPGDGESERPTPEEIYNFVRDKVMHAPKDKFYPREANEVINEMQATRVEKNLIFMGLLTEAGYSADPILISSRPHGRISPQSPNLLDFNHVIVRLKDGMRTSYHDVAYDNYPFDLMPTNSHSGLGLPVVDEQPELVSFPVYGPNSKRQVLTSCTLDEDGTLRGSFSIKSSTYYAVSERYSYLEAEDDLKYAYENIVDHLPGIIVDSVRYDVPMDDMGQPVILDVYFELPDFADFSGDLVYLPTTFFQAFEQNYLVRDERHSEIEFSKTFLLHETVNLLLPEGYEVVEVPVNALIQGPDILFRKMITVSGQNAQLSWQHQLTDIIQPSSNYEALKSFYTQAVATDQSKIVLKRSGS